MGDDERKKKKAKSAIRTNLSDLSNALSDDATVFDDVVKACGTKSLITRKQSQEYTTNTARNTLDNRAGSLVHNIMTTVEFAPEALDTFLCILYDSENVASRRVAVKIADAYGYNLPKYHDRAVAQDNENIDGEAANPPPTVAARQRRVQVETSQESLQRQPPPEHGNADESTEETDFEPPAVKKRPSSFCFFLFCLILLIMALLGINFLDCSSISKSDSIFSELCRWSKDNLISIGIFAVLIIILVVAGLCYEDFAGYYGKKFLNAFKLWKQK